MKTITLKKKILINKCDMDEVTKTEAKKVTFMGLGNFKVDGSVFEFLPNDTDYSNTLKITWLSGETQKITMKYFG